MKLYLLWRDKVLIGVFSDEALAMREFRALSSGGYITCSIEPRELNEVYL